MKYFLEMEAVAPDHTDCEVCGKRRDTTLWLPVDEKLSDDIASIELCDECRDRVLVRADFKAAHDVMVEARCLLDGLKAMGQDESVGTMKRLGALLTELGY